jgi:hypothetical protein
LSEGNIVACFARVLRHSFLTNVRTKVNESIVAGYSLRDRSLSRRFLQLLATILSTSTNKS